MLAEDYAPKEYKIQTSINPGTTIELIIEVIKSTPPYFSQALNNPDLAKPLNENALTQILVEQIDIQIRKGHFPFGVKNQYSDIFFKSKGYPDFYFHNLEEGKHTPALFVVESKRLPAPSNDREKEYVIGESLKRNGLKECNGGIERFKIEKHGLGLSQCGMIGFLERENYKFWMITINGWIDELAISNEEWDPSEILNNIETKADYSYSLSLVMRKFSNNLKLHHLWVMIK